MTSRNIFVLWQARAAVFFWLTSTDSHEWVHAQLHIQLQVRVGWGPLHTDRLCSNRHVPRNKFGETAPHHHISSCSLLLQNRTEPPAVPVRLSSLMDVLGYLGHSKGPWDDTGAWYPDTGMRLKWRRIVVTRRPARVYARWSTALCT